MIPFIPEEPTADALQNPRLLVTVEDMHEEIFFSLGAQAQESQDWNRTS